MLENFHSIFLEKKDSDLTEDSTLKTIYGEFEVKEQVLIDLLNCKAMQRLKKIRQGGMTDYVFNEINYTRYDHSVGVLVLLKKFDACLNEQIAGLLHDVSHTAFSHVADVVFNHNDPKESYQDSIHEWYITNTDIPDILKKHNLDVKTILHKNNNYKILEQDLPNICADRLEYNLHTAYLNGMLTEKDVKDIIQNLKFENGFWYFNDINYALKFAYIPLKLNESSWALDVNLFIYHLTGKLLRRAFDLKIISYEDFHFKDDEFILNKLYESADFEIQMLIYQIFNFDSQFSSDLDYNFDLHIKGKFRGIDPIVKINNKFTKLTKLNLEFKFNYEEIRTKLSQGVFFKFN